MPQIKATGILLAAVLGAWAGSPLLQDSETGSSPSPGEQKLATAMAELAVACETSKLGTGLRDWFATQGDGFWHEAAVSGIETFCEQLVIVTVMVPALRDELVAVAGQLGAGS